MKLTSLEPNAHYDMVNGAPAVLQKDNDGSCLYRLNITPESGIDEDSKEEKQVGYSCFEIRTYEKPTKAVLKKAVIRAVIDETAEFDLVNSYNKHVLGIAENDDAVAEYKEYLQFTEDLDAQIVSDLSNS